MYRQQLAAPSRARERISLWRREVVKGETGGFYKFTNSSLLLLLFLCGFPQKSAKGQRLLRSLFSFNDCLFFKRNFLKALRAILRRVSKALVFKIRPLHPIEVAEPFVQPRKGVPFVQKGSLLKSYVFSFFFQGLAGVSFVFPKTMALSGFFSCLAFFDLLGLVFALLSLFFSACL